MGLLFGGRSVEHEVSVVSARGVARAMRATDLECVPIGVTGEGRWLSPELSARILDGELARVDPIPDDGVRLLVDPGGGGLIRDDGRAGRDAVALDVGKRRQHDHHLRWYRRCSVCLWRKHSRCDWRYGRH